MSDYLFYVVGIIFIFIVWLYAGGPNNPFSFTGPYITPITDVDTTQVGYDDPGASFWGSANTPNESTDVVVDSAKSPYSGSVRFIGSDPDTGDEGSEYMAIRSDTDTDVIITGWQLVSAKSGKQYRIPEGTLRSKTGTIRISDGDEAVIITSTKSNSNLKGYYTDAWNAYLGERRDIWDDRSDTITLLDSNGKVVDQYRY
jgi:hypothetical protein